MLNAPDSEVERLLRAAMQAFNARQGAAARDLARQVLLRQPGNPGAQTVLGALALDAGDFAAARRHLNVAVKARPDMVTLNLLGVALNGVEEYDAAAAAWRQAGALGSLDAWRNLGLMENRRRNFSVAIEAFQNALALDPNDSGAHAGLAHAYETGHDLERARRHAEAALARDPGNDTARVALARVLLRQKDFARAEAVAAPLAHAASANPDHRVIALGVIGDARDRAGDTAAAFAAFSAANDIALSRNRHWLAETRRLYHPHGVQAMTDFAARADVPAWKSPMSFDNPAPVFFVGFPRSGTTLLDQILSSHSGVVCIEEREHFSDALREVFKEPGDLEKMGSLDEAQIAHIRAAYWDRVQADAPDARGKLVIDKMPLNIVVLPLIRAVFPDAKVICALRDPRDCVLSCFQQRFGMNAAMAQFLRLDAAAAYYEQVMRLYQTCRERLGLTLHEVRYEDVVSDLEGAARALAAFLGVAYEPAMLQFRETALKRQIATPSLRQVTEPLYARSVGRWRRYERELAPVLPLLNAWAERFGYAP